MANVNAPFGARPVGSMSGTAYNGRITRYYVASTDPNPYYEGDIVIPAATSDVNGVPAAILDTNGTGPDRGIIVGIEAAGLVYPPGAVPSLGGTGVNVMTTQVSIPATKNQDYYIYVADDPHCMFFMQGDGTATNQVAAKSQYNCSFTQAAPSTATMPLSASVINSGSIATTSTLNIKLLGLAQIPGNAFGAYAIWCCTWNLHDLSGAGVTGV